jgi:hypothetical protein
MIDSVVLKIEKARNYQLKRWAEKVADMKDESLWVLKIDLRDNQSMKEYLFANADLAKIVVD